MDTAGNQNFISNLPDQEFSVYCATDGVKLWTFHTKTAVSAGAISYLKDS